MGPDLNQERQRAHLPPGEKLNAVRGLLEVMTEPLACSLTLSPVEDWAAVGSLRRNDAQGARNGR